MLLSTPYQRSRSPLSISISVQCYWDLRNDQHECVTKASEFLHSGGLCSGWAFTQQKHKKQGTMFYGVSYVIHRLGTKHCYKYVHLPKITWSKKYFRDKFLFPYSYLHVTKFLFSPVWSSFEVSICIELGSKFCESGQVLWYAHEFIVDHQLGTSGVYPHVILVSMQVHLLSVLLSSEEFITKFTFQE